ncbi:DNA-directed RNA polymerase II core subunit, partial [Coelomomyces lativittatus]
MNLPDRFELFILPEGTKKIKTIPDTRLQNAATFEIQREDHTLGALLTAALLKDKRVLFAGYKVPHPLEHLIQVRVQTTDKTTPTQALQTAIESIINEISSIKLHFD